MRIQIILTLALISLAASNLVFLETLNGDKKCAKVQCSGKAVDDKNVCLDGNGAANTVRTMTLNQCKDTQVCSVKEDIFTTDNATVICTDKLARPTRYAGEQCQVDGDCFSVNSDGKRIQTCENKVCFGKKATEVCQVANDCVKGNSCIGGKCAPQLGLGEVATFSFDCKNDLLVIDGKCAKYGSLKVGESTEKVADSVDLACETFRVKDGKCAIIEYNATKNVNMPVSGGFVKCQVEDTCWGSIFTNAEKKDGVDIDLGKCECSFNTEGEGWCPGNQEYRISLIKKYNEASKDRHTAARFDGVITENINCKEFTRNYFGITDCHKKALGFEGCSSSGFIKLSLVALALLALIFA